MIFTAILMFCLAVVLGSTLVVLGLRYHRGSLLLSIGHVSFALLGFGLLWREVLTNSTFKLYNVSALLFSFALFGGLILLAMRISKREYRTAPSMFFVFLHALMALIALLLLVLGYSKY